MNLLLNSMEFQLNVQHNIVQHNIVPQCTGVLLAGFAQYLVLE